MSKTRTIKVAPSLLSADFGDLKREVGRVEDGGCDYLHVDVMDGHFVPNITIGPFIVSALKKIARVPLDTHLMIDSPWKYIEEFAKAGSSHITVHEEACGDKLGEVLKQIKQLGCTRGVSLRPKTGIDVLKPYLSDIDMVLIMTVEPGFGGQKFMEDMMPKVRDLRKIYTGDIEVDGGIDPTTGARAVEAGANVLVAGTAIFKNAEPARVIQAMKALGKQ